MRARLLAIAVAAGVSASAAPAAAATFSVNPTQVYLEGRTTTALVTLRNDSTEVMRFQVSAFTWQQSPAGAIELAPTQDVVFFPALVALKPGEERKIRVGTTAAATAVEKTYRIFVEELPPVENGTAGSEVRVLTKMGIPIFLRPAKEAAGARVADLALNGGALRFAVANAGNVHLVPQQIVVRGIAGDGATLFDETLAAWYILAGGRRDFDLAIPAAACDRVAAITVEARFETTAVKETLQAARGACN
jgi:fimbrial chaperone protein